MGFAGFGAGSSPTKKGGAQTTWGTPPPPPRATASAPAPPPPTAPAPTPAPTVGGGGGGGGSTMGGLGTGGGGSGPTRGGGGAAPGTAGTLGDYGEGLLDPESELSKRWMEQLREQIGKSSDAAQRAAAYQSAQSGFGAGASPELLEMQNAIAQQGQEAQGTAASDYLLRAPTLGIGAMGTALGAQTTMRGQDITGRGQDLQSRMAQQANLLSREQSNAALEMQQRNLDLQYRQQEQDRYLRELMMLYGG